MGVSARVSQTGDLSRNKSVMPGPIEYMIPVECVVRNICARSMAKRYGIPEGTKLREPVFEFFLKSDSLHDPLCNDDHVRVLGLATTSLSMFVGSGTRRPVKNLTRNRFRRDLGEGIERYREVGRRIGAAL